MDVSDRNTDASSHVSSLAGGLGNQLFQLAFGLSQTNGNLLELEWSLGNPRLGNDGKPELLQFELPHNVRLNPRRHVSWFERKYGNLVLRMSALSQPSQSSWNVKSILLYLSSYGLRSMNWKEMRVLMPKGVGFDPNAVATLDPTLFVGYFQSYKWAERPEVLAQLKSLRIRNESKWLQEIKSLATQEVPLVLHLRLGDYQSEATFGTPSKEFYESAVDELWRSGKFKKIWIFSDDPEGAKALLPQWILDCSRWISGDQGSASSNLEAMRYGAGYVISNSTFSWWGAFLSHNDYVQVIVPTPWFKLAKEPLDIVPKNWIRKPS